MKTGIKLSLLIACCMFSIAGCARQTEDLIVGDWIRPTGLRDWDGRLTGEDFAIRFKADHTYVVLARGYEDQYSEDFSAIVGDQKAVGKGTWDYEEDKLLWHDDGWSSAKWFGGFTVLSVNGEQLQLHQNRGTGVRPAVFYRVNFDALKRAAR
jgi:hypothetical protein